MFRLKELRESKGLTRKELAKLSGVHEKTIVALETGVNNPLNAKLSTLLALCKALHTKVKYLYPEERNIA